MVAGVKVAKGGPATVSADVPSRAALIAVAALLGAVTNAVSFMLPPLLPLMKTEYGLDVNSVTWIFTALTLGGGAGFLLVPRLLDILNDRTTILISGSLLMAGTLLPAVSHTYVALLIGAALLGLGTGAQLLPLGFLRRHLGGDAIATAVGVIIMMTGIGVVLGMFGGALTVKWLSLAAFFYIMTGVFLFTTIVLVLVVPPSQATVRSRIGVLSTAWMIGSVTLVLLALTQGQEWGAAGNLLLAAGIVSVIVWVFVERRSESALFDVEMFRTPFVTTACLAGALFGAVDSALLLLVSYYAETPHEVGYGLGTDALGISILMLPFGLTMLISGRKAEQFIERGQASLILIGGAAICAVGLVWLVFFHDQSWHYLVGSGIVGLGSRAGYAAAFAVPQEAVDEDHTGMAGGLVGVVMAIGFSAGAVLVSRILSMETTKAGVPAGHLYTLAYAVIVACPVIVVLSTFLAGRRAAARGAHAH